MNHRLLFTLGIATLLGAGCAWVKPTLEGQNVRLLTAEEARGCKEIGKTTASLADKILGFKRSAAKVKTELETLARNSAANIGGDTIAPVSEIKDGQQTFAVYKCFGSYQYNNEPKD